MQRYLLEIEYDGTQYFGWQKQPDKPTIQGEIEKALNTIFRSDVNIVAAGRTDTGVHALQQFAHFDLNDGQTFEASQLLHSLRGLIPHDINVKSVVPVSSEFHARFDAISRSYIYKISNKYSVFDTYSWFIRENLDVKIMNEAALLLIGVNDFSSFCKKNKDVNHYRCEVMESELKEYADGKMEYFIKANRFLHHMVRSIVGNLVDVGRGKMHLSEFEKKIHEPDRENGGYTAPAQGLFLAKIDYGI